MMQEETELQKRNILRLPNGVANRITRECIQTALVSLISQKDMNKITISELVKRAGVSRTAFYNNYSSKEDVLNDLSNALFGKVNALIWRAVFNNSPYNLYHQLFQEIRDDSYEFAMLLKVGSHTRDFMNIRNFIDMNYPELDIQIRYLVLGWWGAIQNIILDWYLRGMVKDVSYMANFCCELSGGLLKRILEVDPCIMEKYAQENNG